MIDCILAGLVAQPPLRAPEKAARAPRMPVRQTVATRPAVRRMNARG